MYKAFGEVLASTWIVIVIVGASWASFFPAHMKRVFDASPGNAFALFTVGTGLAVLLIVLVLFCGAWLCLACRRKRP